MVSALVLAVLMLSATGVFAKHQQDGVDDPSRDAVPNQHCLLSSTPLPGAPFSAEVAIWWQPLASSQRPALRASARYYRDREGRVRVEQRVGGDSQPVTHVLVVSDFNTPWAYQLDPAARTARTIPRGLAEMMVGSGCGSYFVLPLSMRRFIPFFQRDVDEESLGRQFVAGVLAAGTRFTTIESGRGERWVSPELKLVVHLREEHPKFGTVEYRLTAIGNDETRPELFEVPADYEVISAEYPITWENPHSEKIWLTR